MEYGNQKDTKHDVLREIVDERYGVMEVGPDGSPVPLEFGFLGKDSNGKPAPMLLNFEDAIMICGDEMVDEARVDAPKLTARLDQLREMANRLEQMDKVRKGTVETARQYGRLALDRVIQRREESQRRTSGN